MDGDYPLAIFWRQLLVYSALLGVYLIFLGIAHAGLISALRKRNAAASNQPH